jgi:hypothetical protein
MLLWFVDAADGNDRDGVRTPAHAVTPKNPARPSADAAITFLMSASFPEMSRRLLGVRAMTIWVSSSTSALNLACTSS